MNSKRLEPSSLEEVRFKLGASLAVGLLPRHVKPKQVSYEEMKPVIAVITKIMDQRDFSIMFVELMNIGAEISERDRIPLDSVKFMDVVSELRKRRVSSKSEDKSKRSE